MADPVKDEVVDAPAPDFLNMSDEDAQNFDPSSMSIAAPVIDDEAKTQEQLDADAEAAKAAALEADEAAKNTDGKGAGDETKTDEKVDVGSGAAAAKSGADETPATPEQAAAAAAKAATDKEKVGDDGKAKAGDEGAKAGSDADGAIDYKAMYEKVMAPFKANGREMQAKSPEDAQALMQMGANYNKKMAGLKPAMKFVKMLEANGLLDEEKLGFLIDVHKRDPNAINKLVVDSKMDPLDLSADKASEYKPGNHKVNEQELELDDVIADLRGSEHFDRTLAVVASEWDPKSKGVIAATPQILKVINGHMESGIYDLIAAELESERAFGRLKGLSDLDAYKQVGDAIEARGGFKHLNLGSSQAQAKPAPATPVVVQPKLKPADDDELKNKKRAASGSKAAAPGTSIPADFNPFAMSDTDFAKFQL
jgi:hypothetical protein